MKEAANCEAVLFRVLFLSQAGHDGLRSDASFEFGLASRAEWGGSFTLESF